MPYTTSWYIENRVIKTHYQGEISEAEMTRCGEEIEAMIKTGTPPTFLILDMREVTRFPSKPKFLLQKFSVSRVENPVQWTILISNNSLLKFANAVVTSAMGVSTKTCTSFEEVHLILSRIAPDLAPMLSLQDANL